MASAHHDYLEMFVKRLHVRLVETHHGGGEAIASL